MKTIFFLIIIAFFPSYGHAKEKKFLGYPLVVIVRQEGLEILLNDNNLPEETVNRLLPDKRIYKEWVFMGIDERDDNGEPFCDRSETLPIQDGKFNIFIDLPGNGYARYRLRVLDFKDFLNGQAEWIWKPEFGTHNHKGN